MSMRFCRMTGSGYAKYIHSIARRSKNYILRNSGNESDAADIFNEGLMAIMRRARRGALQLTCPFGAYLMMVCRSFVVK